MKTDQKIKNSEFFVFDPKGFHVLADNLCTDDLQSVFNKEDWCVFGLTSPDGIGGLLMRTTLMSDSQGQALHFEGIC